MFQSKAGGYLLRKVKRLHEWFKPWHAKLSAKRPYLIGAILMFASLAFGAAMLALNNALFFDGFAEDGAFQLLNPLRRIMEGQVIGRDFNFFHGVGTPLIHLPSYLLFGQGMFGEEMTRWLVSPLVFVVSTFCFFYAFRRKFVFALAISAIATVVALLTMPFMVLPITSILAVRSVMPVFVMAVMLLRKRLDRNIFTSDSRLIKEFTWYELIIGVLLAVSLICGTEFGIAAIIAFVIVNLVFKTPKQLTWRERVWDTARVFGIVVVSIFALLSIITLGNPIPALKYAFIDIVDDQCWYFGSPPNTFLYLGTVWQTITRDPLSWPMFIFAVAAIVSMRLVRRRKKMQNIETQAFVFGLLAGAFAMVSMLGYYSATQAGGLARMSLLVIFASGVVLFERWQRPFSASVDVGRFKLRLRVKPLVALRAMGVAYVVAGLISCIVMIVVVKSNYDIFKTLRRAADYVIGTDTNALGGRWAAVDEMITPLIQADNNVEILDVNTDGFVHGINVDKRQVVVDVRDKGGFVRARQIVYLQGLGRGIIQKTSTAGGTRVAVTLQNTKTKLNPNIDGAPNKMIIAEDFNHDSNKVWSLYTGVLNQEMGLVHPSKGGYDYIIHALGKQRREDYVNDFKKIQPEYVIGFARNYFVWEDWIENEHWDFYSLLDRNYEVVKESPIYALWKRKDQPWDANVYSQANWQPLSIDESDNKITIPKPAFDNMPDAGAYQRQAIQDERNRLIGMGREVGKQPAELGEVEYYEYIMQKMLESYQLTQRQHENRGLETDALEAQQNTKMAEDAASQQSPVISSPRPKRQVVLVKIKYEASQPLKWIPLFGRTSRFMLEPNNTYSKTAMSLRPYDNEVVYPIVISELNNDPYILYKTYSLLPGGGSLKIVDAQYTVLETSVENLKLLTD